jgi:hypothetical protein
VAGPGDQFVAEQLLGDTTDGLGCHTEFPGEDSPADTRVTGDVDHSNKLGGGDATVDQLGV